MNCQILRRLLNITAIKNEKQYKKYKNKILVDVLAKLYIIGYSKS